MSPVSSPPLAHRGPGRRRVAGLVLLLLSLTPPLPAIIPGLAPGLVAILPQLILLVFVMLGLLFSPRTWWRIARYAARHPVRAFLTVAPLAALAAIVVLAGALRPQRSAAPAMAILPGGFPPGDPNAAGLRSRGAGPLSVLEAAAFDLPDAPDRAPESSAVTADMELATVAGKVLLLGDGRRRLIALDPPRRRVSWQVLLDAPATCGPIVFERPAGNAEARGGAIILAAQEGAGSIRPAGRIMIVDAGDGSKLGSEDLPGRPLAGAVIDERVIALLPDAVTCLSIADPATPRALWTSPRASRAAVALAGDECGRYYVLDEGELVLGDLDGGPPVTLASFAGERPRALAVRHGLAYVLTENGAGARVDCLDPALGPSRSMDRPGGRAREPLRWSRSVPPVLGGKIALASFGLVLTSPMGITVIHPSTGATLNEVGLDPGPLCPAAPAGPSCFALLADGSAVRYSPGLARIEWHAESGVVPRAGASPGFGTPSLVACGDRLIVSTGRELRVFADAGGQDGLAWGHWRGSPSRRGAPAGAQAPLTARVLWSHPLREGPPLTGPADPKASPRRLPGTILPLDGGFAVLRSTPSKASIDWVAADGSSMGREEMEGVPRGIVRQAARVLIAVEESGKGLVSCRDGAVSGDGGARRSLWVAALPALSSRNVLAATPELVLACLRDSLRALSLHDGARRWNAPEAACGTAPLAAGERVFVACGGGPSGPARALVSLSATDGTLAWRRSSPDWAWGPLSLGGDRLVAAAAAPGGPRLVALSPRDGSILWEALVPGASLDFPVVVSDAELIVRLDDGAFLIVSAEGKTRGRIEPDSDIDTGPGLAAPPPVSAIGAVLLSGGVRLRCIDTLLLEPIWEIGLGSAIAPVSPIETIEDIVLQGDRVLAATRDALTCIGAE